MNESALATQPAEAWVSEADRRDTTIANYAVDFELKAMKQYRRDLDAGVPHAERRATLLAALDNAPRQAEHRWRHNQRRIPPEVRAEILPGDCVYCRREATTIDHIFPVSRGGTRERDNLAPACDPCNQEKDDRTVAEWMKYRAEQGLPWPPTSDRFCRKS